MNDSNSENRRYLQSIIEGTYSIPAESKLAREEL